ncbi:MAG: hypothetical protein WAT79_02815, partial [Saprospiraceae bacterium]
KYVGLCLGKQEKYQESARMLKKFVSLIKPDHPDFLPAIQEIKRCGKAQQLLRNSQLAFVENAGNAINSSGWEMRPVYSPNYQDRIYFSSNRQGSTGGKRNDLGLINEEDGHYFADMYYSDFIEGNWTNPTTFLPLLNTAKHDMVTDFNSEGNILFYSVSLDQKKYDFYADTFSVEYYNEKLPIKVDLPIQGDKGDKDLFFFNDSLLFFTSSHLPGFGGYDLFYSKKINGFWQNPVNLGSEVNSKFDDISPYFTKGGNMLYFSSNRLDGLGGYDIFLLEFDVEKWSWKNPVNLGLPVNSSWDENHFILSPDGMNGVFTSNKPGGFGKTDLYLAYFKEQIIEQLLFAEWPNFLDTSLANLVTIEQMTPKPRLKKEIRLRSLYYSSNDDVLSQPNAMQLLLLAENMLIYPDTKLTMYCHSFQETSRDMDLYLSLKRLETVRDFLLQKGIDSERITLKACGSSFPLATPYINGIKSNIAERNNKRIDFDLIPITSDIEVVQEDFGISASFRDERYARFRTLEDTFVFRLLIAQSQQMYRSEVLNIYDDIYIEKVGNQEMNHYMLGQFEKYLDAVQFKNELSRQHNIKATIIPYFKGKPLDKLLFPYKVEALPELKIFIQNEK